MCVSVLSDNCICVEAALYAAVCVCRKAAVCVCCQLSHVMLCFQSEHEQLNYARQLKERLEAFTQEFLPHMKEEEEVTQSPSYTNFTSCSLVP